MANTYRAVSGYGKATFGEDLFDGEFTAADERDYVDSGHLEIVPRSYRQTSNNYSATEQGGTFEAAFLVEVEAALIAGGHIERVADKPRREPTKKG